MGTNPYVKVVYSRNDWILLPLIKTYYCLWELPLDYERNPAPQHVPLERAWSAPGVLVEEEGCNRTTRGPTESVG